MTYYSRRTRRSARATAILLICLMFENNVFAIPPASDSYLQNTISEIGNKLKGSVEFFDSYFTGPASVVALSTKTASAKVQIDKIVIQQGDLVLSQGEAVSYVATAFNREQTVGGILFKWTVTNAESGETRSMLNGRYEACLPGRYIVRVSAEGYRAEANLTVKINPGYGVFRLLRKPVGERTAAEQRQIEEWTASGVLTTRAVSSRDNNKSGPGGRITAEDKKRRELAKNAKVRVRAEGNAERISSVADPLGWDGSNYGAADDPGNWVGRPMGAADSEGAANGNFNLTAPAVQLDGRGIDINLNLEYNSRVWSKSGTTVMTYNADSGYPAPGWNLGFGRMFYMGASGGSMLVAPDGTRRPYAGTSTVYSSGGLYQHTYVAHTTDGSMIDYYSFYSSSGGTTYLTGAAAFPDGTVMLFGAPTAGYDQIFPYQIQDAHGNYVDITYVGSTGPEISTITDTLGRTINFNYSSGYLSNITGPGYNGTTRTFLNLQYDTKTVDTTFNGSLSVSIANSTPKLIEAIHYPTTNTGYWFGESDSYSDYGMIATVRSKRGMTWASGAVSASGTTTRQEAYNFQTPSSALTDAPGYTTHTETFDGIDTSSLVTTYGFATVSGVQTITTTAPNLTRRIEISDMSSWDGMKVETILMPPFPSTVELDKTVLTLDAGYNGSNRVKYIDHTDDKAQTTRKELAYGTNYNQVTSVKEYEDGGSTLYRERRYTYENSSNYTNRNILNLVKTVEDYDNSSVRLTRTVFTYDGSTPVDAADIVQFLYTHNPHTTETVPGPCQVYNDFNCSYEGQVIGGEITCVCEQYSEVSAYDSSTGYRGDLTNVTTYTDGYAATGSISYDYTYDIAGNQRTGTTNCCQQIGSSYSTATQYLLPDSMTKGSSNPMSSDRITQSYTYDANTKVPTAISDFNGLSTSIAYDAVERPTLVTLNSGGKKLTTYTDSSGYITEHVKKADNTTVSQSKTYFNGRGQVNKSEYQAGSSNWNGTQRKYDEMGRVSQVSRPYDTGSPGPSYWATTSYDDLGRVLQQESPDAVSAVAIAYNPNPTVTPTPAAATSNVGQTVTTTDAWGRERWTRYDFLGRLVEVVEPNPAGNGAVSASGALTTAYAYDRLDRLVTITQGTGGSGQTRSFGYDSLGRLTHQKLPEQEASLLDDGTYNTSSGTWSDVFEYDSRSNLTQRTDARGVITTYDYTVSSSPDPLNRLQSISYNNSQSDPTINAAPTVTFDYMTTGDKTRVKKVTTSGVATEENAFDGEGRIASYELILAAHTGKPFKTEYTYDTAHRLTQVKYPKRYGITLNSVADPQMLVSPSYDEASRLSQMNVNSDTVNNDVILSDISYNTSSQVTSSKTATAETHPRVESYSYDAATGLLTGQTLKNAALSTTYMDLSYSYTRNGSAGTSSSSEKTGQMTKMENNVNHQRDRKYQFDALGRLEYAKGGLAAGASSGTANWTQQYTYDRYGNKTAVAVSGNYDQNGNPVPADGLTSTATTTSTNRITAFTYDRAGNIVRGQNASGVWQQFEYDAAGRLTNVQNDSNVDIETYTYGAGRQKLVANTIGADTTYYVWGGNSIIAEYLLNSSNPRYQKAYVYAGSRLLMTTERASGTTESRKTHHPDRLGTKRVTDIDSGAEIEQSTLPFGTAFGAEGSGGYSNQVFTSYDRSSATGLDYASNRTYSSGQGRFMQVDPIGMASATIGDPQSNNLYAYTQNMPTDFVDPSGLFKNPNEIGPFISWYEFCQQSGLCRGGTNIEYPEAQTSDGGGGGVGGSKQEATDCQNLVAGIGRMVERVLRPSPPELLPRLTIGSKLWGWKDFYSSIEKQNVDGFRAELVAHGQRSDVYRHVTASAASTLLEIGLASWFDDYRNAAEVNDPNNTTARKMEEQVAILDNKAGRTIGNLVAHRVRGGLRADELLKAIKEVLCDDDAGYSQ